MENVTSYVNYHRWIWNNFQPSSKSVLMNKNKRQINGKIPVSAQKQTTEKLRQQKTPHNYGVFFIGVT